MSEFTDGVVTFDCAGCSPYCYGGYHMEEDKDGYGDWVKAEDCRKLRAELAAAKVDMAQFQADVESEVQWLRKELAARDLAIKQMREAIDRLIEACNESDSAAYGTLATWFVTEACETAIALQPSLEALDALDAYVKQAVEEEREECAKLVWYDMTPAQITESIRARGAA